MTTPVDKAWEEGGDARNPVKATAVIRNPATKLRRARLNEPENGYSLFI
jgi:hypothetical protein